MTVGDMHHAVVALEELGGVATPKQVAVKLGWYKPGGSVDVAVDGLDLGSFTHAREPDERRAETALLAAAEQGYAGDRR